MFLGCYWRVPGNGLDLNENNRLAIEGDYVVAGDKVTLSAPDLDDEDIVLNFSISGDKLTMTDEYGDVTEFTRVK